MVELYSQYVSGNQTWAGTMAGSVMGVSGINPIIDRLNSISQNNNLITANSISGTSTLVYPGSVISKCFVLETRSSNPGEVTQGRLWLEV